MESNSFHLAGATRSEGTGSWLEVIFVQDWHQELLELVPVP